MGNGYSESFGKDSKKVFELDDVITFGKYKGNTIDDVIHDDYGYIEWCLDNLAWFKISENVYEQLNKAMASHYESLGDFDYGYEDDYN